MMITLTTDFGWQDAFVGIMKGVIATIHPQVTLIDLTHGIPAQNVLAGALTLRHAVNYFPSGTIHLAVVDPGVGTTRVPLLIQSSESFFIGPDNGLLSLALGDRDPDCIIRLTNSEYHLRPTSGTFHGRDIFAPAAAYLSRGVPPRAFGDEVASFRRLTIPQPRRESGVITGEIIYIDHFGNLFTNLSEPDLTDLPQAGWKISFGAGFQVSGIAPNYASSAGAELVAVQNSWGLLEIAAPGGSAQQRTGAGVGEPVKIFFSDEFGGIP